MERLIRLQIASCSECQGGKAENSSKQTGRYHRKVCVLIFPGKSLHPSASVSSHCIALDFLNLKLKTGNILIFFPLKLVNNVNVKIHVSIMFLFNFSVSH